MNKDEILTMEAGREMDALIAEKVMNKTVIRAKRYIQNEIKPRHARNYGKRLIFEYVADGLSLKEYSTNISAVWDVVEKMESEEFWFEFSNIIPNSDPVVYEARFQKSTQMGYACEETAPLAISKAALIANMGIMP